MTKSIEKMSFDAVASFEKGVALKKHCEKMLKEAKLKIEKVTITAENKIEFTEVEV